ncbi:MULTISPECIES: hypothetical protein [unclassified Paenibacillus]|nr:MULTISPECIES: hypothetical protein [unclassified Paenibacillus]
MMPWEFVELPRHRKAALVAMIVTRVEKEKKEMKKSGNRKRR